MRSNPVKRFWWVVVLVILVSTACGPSASPEPAAPPTEAEKPTEVEQPTEAPLPTEAPEPTEEPEPTVPSNLVTSLQDLKSAIVQIEAQGTFIDPEIGLITNGAGRGSGFIIDPAGIAVTNNHVVTGAALLKVWVGGESSPRNAKVLGVSECSDLAVIDIEGDDFAYLDWYGDPVSVGMDIYVAGFPLGDPEFTLTRGVISKAKASGETSWASVDSVIEYDATTNPGNSGGPVVNSDAQVIGIHYAGDPSARQSFGISRDVAKRLIDQLKAGENVDWIGVNGQAVGTEDGSLTGIWVSSVQSGSPADKAGVKAGDIITMLESLVLATDGTMADYCDILRSHNPEDTLSVEVLRWASSEVMEGQLNGRELATTMVFDPGVAEDPGGSTAPSGSQDAYYSGDIYLETEFDEADDWSTFAVPDSDNYDANLYEGVLSIYVPEEQSTVYALYDYTLPADVRLDALVETVGGPNTNNISLVCRATDAGWYEFSMGSGGYWYIWKYEDDEYFEMASGATTAINLQKSANELTATCIGNELTFYVNLQEVGSIRDRTFMNDGQVGISVSTLGIRGAEVEFDTFLASVP